MVFQFGKNKQVVVPYDTTTHFTIITSDKDTTNLYECFGFGAWTTDEQSNNFTYDHSKQVVYNHK